MDRLREVSVRRRGIDGLDVTFARLPASVGARSLRLQPHSVDLGPVSLQEGRERGCERVWLLSRQVHGLGRRTLVEVPQLQRADR